MPTQSDHFDPVAELAALEADLAKARAVYLKLEPLWHQASLNYSRLINRKLALQRLIAPITILKLAAPRVPTTPTKEEAAELALVAWATAQATAQGITLDELLTDRPQTTTQKGDPKP